jgi:hypothetical protein
MGVRPVYQPEWQAMLMRSVTHILTVTIIVVVAALDQMSAVHVTSESLFHMPKCGYVLLL